MATYYVKPDESKVYPDKRTLPVTEASDGLTEVSIPATSVPYFTRYWWMFKLLENGEVQSPLNFPDLSTDYLRQIIDQQANQLEEARTELATAQEDAATAKQDAAATKAENVTLKANDSLHDSAIMELSDLLFSQMAPATSTTSEATAAGNSTSDSTAVTK